MNHWSDLDNVVLDVNSISPEQMERLLRSFDKEKHEKILKDLDDLLLEIKAHKQTVILARKILSLVFSKLISVV